MVFTAIAEKPNSDQPCSQVETAQVTDLTARTRNEVSALITEAGYVLFEKYKMGCSKLHQPQTNMPPAIIKFMA